MVYGSGPDCLGYDAAGGFPSLSEVAVVPFKANAERRHHIPKQRHRVQTRPSMMRPCVNAAV